MDYDWIMDIGLPAAIFDQIYTSSAFSQRILWNIYIESLISLNCEVTVVVQVISCMLACAGHTEVVSTMSWLTEPFLCTKVYEFFFTKCGWKFPNSLPNHFIKGRPLIIGGVVKIKNWFGRSQGKDWNRRFQGKESNQSLIDKKNYWNRRLIEAKIDGMKVFATPPQND